MSLWAREETYARFWADWSTLTPALNGGAAPLVVWEAVERRAAPPADAPWARVSMQHNTSGQRSMGAPGQRRFERQGIVSVQIFVPLALNRGTSLIEGLAKVAVDAFEGRHTPGGVWFRNVRQQSIEPEEPWMRLNVVSEFVYDELK